jgi:hypothetical protein
MGVTGEFGGFGGKSMHLGGMEMASGVKGRRLGLGGGML